VTARAATTSRLEGLAWWPLCIQIGRCTATTILIRHADVPAGGGTDPSLNPAGLARAQELRHVLRDAGISAIFVTQFQRSRQTAAPLAADLGLVPTIGDDVALTIDALRNRPASSVALVVGHTNTLPQISAALGNSSMPAIGAAEFDRLFVHSRGRLTHLRYGA
jgi:phosphohistidine phosphatase SixA